MIDKDRKIVRQNTLTTAAGIVNASSTDNIPVEDRVKKVKEIAKELEAFVFREDEN